MENLESNCEPLKKINFSSGGHKKGEYGADEGKYFLNYAKEILTKNYELIPLFI